MSQACQAKKEPLQGYKGKSFNLAKDIKGGLLILIDSTP